MDSNTYHASCILLQNLIFDEIEKAENETKNDAWYRLLMDIRFNQKTNKQRKDEWSRVVVKYFQVKFY